MSGICGLWSIDPADADVQPILHRLQRRGPDGVRHWSDGNVALGQALLATTPEALVEKLPLTDPVSGCTITADVRLDNRDVLLSAIELGNRPDVVGDGELVLHAYLKWGEDCPARLLGDFAFAIWDPARQRLFCARDHMGMRQLIYHHVPGTRFVFATDVDALIAHPTVPKRINEGRIADYLDNLEGLDFTSTFFEDVLRLPPAHGLTVTPDGLSLRRFWSLKSGQALELDTDEDYAKAFLKTFTEAVRCRLRSVGPVGAMLSGGMDSNSVVAVAARLLAAQGKSSLRTFSAVDMGSSNCAETGAIQTAIREAGDGISPTTIDVRALDDMRDSLTRAIHDIDEPFDGSMSMIRSVYLAAARQGIKIVLDGVAGDVILSSDNRVAALARRLLWRKAVREVRLKSQYWNLGRSTTTEAIAAFWAGLAPRTLRAWRRRVIQKYQERELLAGRSTTDPTFAKRIGLAHRRARFQKHVGNTAPIGPDHRARCITHPHLVVGRERYDRVAAQYGIEPRDPFMDVPLIELCLSMPASQMQDGGWPKLVLRRAMRGLVPDQIVWRRGKEHLGGSFTRTLLEPSYSATKLHTMWPLLCSYVSKREWADPSSDVERLRGFDLYYLGVWLNRQMMLPPG